MWVEKILVRIDNVVRELMEIQKKPTKNRRLEEMCAIACPKSEDVPRTRGDVHTGSRIGEGEYLRFLAPGLIISL